MLEEAVGGDDVTVFRVDIEEVRTMGALRTITDGVGGDDRSVAMLETIDRRRTDAPTRRDAGDDECIDAICRQFRLQIGSKECACVLLYHHAFVPDGSDVFVDLDGLGAEF